MDVMALPLEMEQKAASSPIRYSTSRPANILADQGKDRNIPLQTRLAQAGLEKVTWYGTISHNELLSESFESTSEDCYYAFILDNTSSKQTKKKCLFSAVNRSLGQDTAEDGESVISNMDESVPVKKTAHSNFSHSQISLKDSPASMNASTGNLASTIPGNGGVSPASIKPLSPSSTSLTDLNLKNNRTFQGYLLKKKRKKLQGFTKRFFKLDMKYGILSYYLNAKSSTCRGEIVIPLSSISANKQIRLIVIDSGMEIWVMKARNEKEWDQWINVLESCFKLEAPTRAEDHEVAGISKSSHDTATSSFLRNLTSLRKKIEECKYQSLSYSSAPIPSPSSAIQTPSTATKQRIESRSSSVSSLMNPFLRQKNGSFIDSGVTTHDAFSSSSSAHQHELYKKLADLEKLAKQLDVAANGLAQQWSTRTPPASLFSDDQYFDANEEPIIVMLNDDVARDNDIRPVYSSYNGDDDDEAGEDEGEGDEDEEDDDEEEELDEVMTPIEKKGTDITKKKESTTDLLPLPINHKIKRRDDIKGPTSQPPSLLSFLKKNVGKDLSTISMPISSNEPVSILQVLAEAFEYSWLLNRAAECRDNEIQRMKYVTTFALSYLSIHRQKTRSIRKPFTPLLGETYELVREDMGIRLISEKVCHKPPIFAFHTENKDWKCSYTVTPVQKFWGKSVEFINEGEFHLTFNNSDVKYKWSQPTIVLKNIIAGERYMEPTNQFSVISSKPLKSVVTFKAGGMFSGRSEDVDVTLLDDNNRKLGYLKGQWTNQIVDAESGEVIWKCGELVENYEKKFGFTKFTANLNEITEIEAGKLPPTDSRLRPDLRLYENGSSSEAEQLKLSLELNQRQRRDKNEDVKPQYFKEIKPLRWIPVAGVDNYWERRKRSDWSNVRPLW